MTPVPTQQRSAIAILGAQRDIASFRLSLFVRLASGRRFRFAFRVAQAILPDARVTTQCDALMLGAKVTSSFLPYAVGRDQERHLHAPNGR